MDRHHHGNRRGKHDRGFIYANHIDQWRGWRLRLDQYDDHDANDNRRAWRHAQSYLNGNHHFFERHPNTAVVQSNNHDIDNVDHEFVDVSYRRPYNDCRRA